MQSKAVAVSAVHSRSGHKLEDSNVVLRAGKRKNKRDFLIISTSGLHSVQAKLVLSPC